MYGLLSYITNTIQKKKQLIMSNFKQQVIAALNIKVGDIKKQIKPVWDLNKDSFDDVLDSNIYDIVANIIDINSQIFT